MFARSARRSISAIGISLCAFACAISAASAWSGPTQSPPNGNVSAPLNVSATGQYKAGNLGVSGYLNFGSTLGSSGYGMRDNGGTVEFKNSGGSWSSLQSTIYNYCAGGSCGSNGTITGVTAGTNMTGGGTSGNVTLSTSLTPTFNDPYVNNWVRINGSGGIYWQAYGGGWYMQDSTWIRSYNSKPVYMSAGLDTGSASGVACGGGLGGGYTFRVCGTSNVTSNEYVNGDIYVGAIGKWVSQLPRNTVSVGAAFFYSSYVGVSYNYGYACPSGAVAVGAAYTQQPITSLEGYRYTLFTPSGMFCAYLSQ